MNISTLKNILAHPNENGFIVFVLGVLFILSFYHFLLYFQHRDKSYLYYSLYTFLIFIGHLEDVAGGFVEILIAPFKEYLVAFDLPIMWTYNLVYYIFAFTLLNIKSKTLMWYHLIFRTVYIMLITSAVVTAYAFWINNAAPMNTFTNMIVPFFIIFGFLCYYLIFKYKLPLRSYIFWGSLVLLVTSVSSFYLIRYKAGFDNDQTSFSIFYMGVIIENLIFSLALGQKQKRILQEKNESQKRLTRQLKENETLRKAIQEKLEKDVKDAQMEELKARYEKELIELKMTSLRSQMNPHFIFNSLNAIKLYIIDNEKENAVYYLNKFSKLIRKILAATREKTITLAEEIETTKLYLEIENIRFANEIDTEVTIDNKLSINTIKVPSLILQPFIENAIWHGLSAKNGLKKLLISFYQEQDPHVVISIQDNGIGREKSAKIKEQKIHQRKSIGIRLTEERLANFCKEMNHQYSLEYIDLTNNNLASGTKVILRIPLS